MLSLSTVSEDMGDISFVKKVNSHLTRLREEMEKLLIRLGDSKHKDWKSKTIFLMNNYDLILSLMHVSISVLASKVVGKRFIFCGWATVPKTT